MKKDRLTDIIGMIDEKYVEEAAFTGEEKAKRAPEPAKRRPLLMRWGAVAAAVLVVAAAGVTTAACVAEAREYDTAVTFFEESGLSTAGLSRSEVKAVYRDITSHSFTYEKTEEVLRRTVVGSEILQDFPTPQQLEFAVVSNSAMNFRNYNVATVGYGYKTEHIYSDDGLTYEKDVLSCYYDSELKWTAELTRSYVTDYKHYDAGTVVWGRGCSSNSGSFTYAWLAMIDDGGTLLWKHSMLDHWYGTETIFSVLDNGDGTRTVFSRGLNASKDNYLCISIYDDAGNELKSTKFKTDDNYFYVQAARLGDGYIIRSNRNYKYGSGQFLYLDAEGNVTGNFSFEEDGLVYSIQDLVEFGGQLYISAYVVPMPSRGYFISSHDEIVDVLNDFLGVVTRFDLTGNPFSNGAEGTASELTGVIGYSEGLTEKLRDNYTAVLLICDSDGGAPKTFYSVKGSLGSTLAVNASGQLEWNVDSIFSAYYSPVTSAFSVRMTCSVYRYTFDASGKLLGSVDTGGTSAVLR